MKKLLLIALLFILPLACAENIPAVTMNFTSGVEAGETVFSAILAENDTARLLAQEGVLTLTMSDLNSNEKFAYLPAALPEIPEQIEEIKAGDILLFGNKCLVIFYQDAVSPYSYTRIGHVEQPELLASALGSGDIIVQFVFASVQE